VTDIKVAPNKLIYLVVKFHIFLRAQDIFPDLISFLCGWEKINQYSKSFFLFLPGRTCQPDPTHNDLPCECTARPACQQRPLRTAHLSRDLSPIPGRALLGPMRAPPGIPSAPAPNKPLRHPPIGHSPRCLSLHALLDQAGLSRSLARYRPLPASAATAQRRWPHVTAFHSPVRTKSMWTKPPLTAHSPS
jgi:hypothetical protein